MVSVSQSQQPQSQGGLLVTLLLPPLLVLDGCQLVNVSKIHREASVARS